MKLIFFFMFILIIALAVLLAYGVYKTGSLPAAILAGKHYFGGDPTEKFGYYTADEGVEYWTCYPETEPFDCYTEGLENEKDKLKMAIKNLEDDYQRLLVDVNNTITDRYYNTLKSFVEKKQLQITYSDIRNIVSTYNDYQSAVKAIRDIMPSLTKYYTTKIYKPESYNFLARMAGYADPKYQFEKLRKERIELDKQLVTLYADLEEIALSKDIIENGRDYVFLNYLFAALGIDIKTLARMNDDDILNLFENRMNIIMKEQSVAIEHELSHPGPEPYIHNLVEQEQKDRPDIISRPLPEIPTYIAPEEQQIIKIANTGGADAIYTKYIMADTLNKYYNTPSIKSLHGKLDKETETQLDTILVKYFNSKNVPVSYSKNILERYLNYIKKGGKRLIKDVELKRLRETYNMSK